jgi:ribosome-binding protein aMBF1 (putative translation factor)
MTKVSDLHKKWSKSPTYRAEYDRLDPEYNLARAIIQARVKAGLTQNQLARKMKTTQSVIARLEGGNVNPSTKTLERLAKATGTCLHIHFVPQGEARI